MLGGFPQDFATCHADDIMQWSFVMFEHYSTAQQFVFLHGLRCMQLWTTL